jgi:hypothetical protein
MTVLSPPPKPAALFTTTGTTNILTILSPALTHSLYFAAVFQSLLSTTTLFVVFRAYFISLIVLRQSFYTSQILLLQSYSAAILLSKQLLATGKRILEMGWQGTEGIRRKLFFELMVFLLGTGYGMLLVVLWPGWIVIGCGAWAVLSICG